MSEPTDPPPIASIFGGKSAARLALALLTGLAVVAAFGVINRPRSAALEQFGELTAVGDPTYLTLPESAQKPPPAAATWEGKPLYPVSYKKLDLRDTKMLRAGRDVATGLTIYRSLDPVPPQSGEREKKGEPMLFLKLAPNAYIKVRATTPGM